MAQLKPWPKQAKIIFTFITLAYVLAALISWWARNPDVDLFKKDMAAPTGLLLTAYTCIGGRYTRMQKPFTPSDENQLYRRITKMASYVLGMLFVVLGIVMFLILLIEKQPLDGLLVLVVNLIISIPLFLLPWSIYYSVRFIKSKLSKP